MITIKEVKKNNGYVYDVLSGGQFIAREILYDEALELGAASGMEVEIIYLSGAKPSFESELQAKRRMDAKGR